MAKRKKRNSITLFSLLLALIILSVFYYWYTNKSKEAKDETGETNTISLASIDTTQLTSFAIKNENLDITLIFDQGEWTSKNDPDRPIDQSHVGIMTNLLAKIDAVRMIKEDADDLGEYGLDQPSITIQAVTEDGTNFKMFIGDAAVTGDGYYAMVNDDKTVYLVNSTIGSGFNYSEEELTQLKDQPDITSSDNITHILVDLREGKDFEIKYMPENDNTYTKLNQFEWTLLQPYGEEYNASYDKLSPLLTAFGDFTFKTCVDYEGKDLGRYGLDQPFAKITVDFTRTKNVTLDSPEKDPDTGKEITQKDVTTNESLKIDIGNQDENGNYYVRNEASNAVYTMAASSVESKIKLNAFDYLNRFVALPNIDNVDKIDAKIGDKEYKMEIKRTTQKDDDGKEVTQATYFNNNTEVTEKNFKNMYQTMISAYFEKEADDESKINKTHPVMSLSYHIMDQDTNLTTVYYPYDDVYYYADNGKSHNFLVDRRVIDAMIYAIENNKVKDYDYND